MLPTSRRIDVLVGERVLPHRRDVQPALVGEGALTDVRLALPRLAGWRARRRSARAPSAAGAAPRRRSGSRASAASSAMIDTRLALPQRSPKPLIVPCTCTAPASTAASEFATASSQSLWQWMPSGSSTAAAAARVASATTARQGASARVAEDQTCVAPAGGRRPQARDRVLGIVRAAVEEVLGVEDDLVGVPPEIGDRVVDHLEILLAGDAQVLAHVEVPGLADDRDHRGLGLDAACARFRSSAAIAPAAPGRAEGGDPRVLEPELLRLAEELLVARIRARPAALDVVERRGRRAARRCAACRRA